MEKIITLLGSQKEIAAEIFKMLISVGLIIYGTALLYYFYCSVDKFIQKINGINFFVNF